MCQSNHSESDCCEMKHERLQNLETNSVITYKDIASAYNISKNYCYISMTRRDIKGAILADNWSSGELLSDIVLDPKKKTAKRKDVAFLLLVEPLKNTLQEEKEILVSCFSVEPWYSIEVATNWADYRIQRALSNNLEFTGVTWFADEFNDELHGYLKELGYKATGYIDTKIRVCSDTETYRKVIFKK